MSPITPTPSNQRPSYRFSRCTDPENAPQEYVFVEIDEYDVELELATAIEASIPEQLHDAVWGDALALIERAERCEAYDPADVKSIATCRTLWELRFHLRAGNSAAELRAYHAEVSALPGHLVSLHVHRKPLEEGETAIERDQKDAIRLASSRWRSGYPSLWGVSPT